MRRNTTVAWQVLGLLLKDRFTLTPQKRGRRMGILFRAEGSLVPLLEGLIPVSAQAGTSPGEAKKVGSGSPPLLSSASPHR
jgi:hypothetical protein